MQKIKVGIAGVGGVGLACAAWIAQRGHDVAMWAPRGGTQVLHEQPLVASGALEASQRVRLVESAQALAAHADVIIVTVPVNGHRMVMDALLPHVRSGQLVIVSAMGSLSALYLYEAALAQGKHLAVASFGATALTARRLAPGRVNIMTRRASVSVSCLPTAHLPDALAMCETLFGGVFRGENSALVSALSNTSAIGHVPLALLNWTRIERAESWPQYHYMTPHVCRVIEQLDAERLAIASAFGLALPGIAQHFIRSFGLEHGPLSEVAAELHRRRGGPPGPVDIGTRYLSEDVPYGLVCQAALARVVGVAAPVTELLIGLADLVTAQPLSAANDLLTALHLPHGQPQALVARLSVADFPSTR